MVNSGVRWFVGWGVVLLATATRGDGDRPADRDPNPKPKDQIATIDGQDPPEPFVPLRPRTADDRRRIEALRDFATARALSDQGKLPEAIDLLEKALKDEPDSVAILRRLSRLSYARTKIDQAVAYARRVLELEPGDTETLTLLLAHYLERRNEPIAAEALLKKILDDPRLVKGSAGWLLAERDLGDVYADYLDRAEPAADAYAAAFDRLDDRTINGLSTADQRRIFRGDEAQTYQRFGESFLKAGRHDLAAKAFRRGLISDPEHPQLPRLLAESLLKSGQADEALKTLEPYLKRQPAGREPFELLGTILKALGREREVLPRLEAAAKADPKNLSLQYALAERFRQEGKPEKADALLKDLLAHNGDPQLYLALATSLLKEKKAEELLKVLAEAAEKNHTFEIIQPQIDAIVDDPPFASEVVDAALKLERADPPRLSDEARDVATRIARQAKDHDRLIELDRLALKRDANARNSKVLFLDLYNAGRYDEAADALAQMVANHPAERTAETLYSLAQVQYLAGKAEKALEVARDVEKLEPESPNAPMLVGAILSKLGRDDEAIEIYKKVLDQFPNNDEIFKRAHAGLSVAYVNKDDLARGEAELELIFEKYPEDAGINNDLGYLYADRGKKLEQAEAMIRKALAEQPDNGAYLDSLGWVLFKRGKVREAVEPLEKAAQDPTVDVTIFDHLGDVYYRLNDYTKARASWKRAEALANRSKPPDKKLAEVRKKLAELGKLAPESKTPAGENP